MVEAVKNGGVFLIDEISLAKDNVLERFNSLLEFERNLFLSESESGSECNLTAHQDFHIIATMNPSGDHGKRELSPALRNRFTEIWVTSVLDNHNINDRRELSEFVCALVQKKYEKNELLSNYLLDLIIFINVDGNKIVQPINLRDIETIIKIYSNN